MDRSRRAAKAAVPPFAFSLILATALTCSAQAQDFSHGPLMNGAAAPGGAQKYLGSGARELLAQIYDAPIPPLAERPLTGGSRVRVIEFTITGLTERPERDISVEGVNAVLTRHLATQPLEGYTMAELQDVADDITTYYRERGLILAQAFVPAQDVKEGGVTLQIVEGSLGAVTVDGNQIYQTDNILGPFTGLVEQPINQVDIEEALLTLQDFPGLTVFGTFRQGQTLGNTELVVSVRDEDRFYLRPSVDNYGSEFTGDVRAMLQFGVNNPFGASDRITGYVLQTESPSNGKYYGLEYEAQTRSAKNAFGFGTAKNNFDVASVGSANTNLLQGEVTQHNVFYERRFANQRRFRADGTLDIAQKDAVITQPGEDSQDELLVLSYTLDFYTVGPRQRGINLGYFRVGGGDNSGANPSRIGGSGELAEGTYGKFDFLYQRLQRLGNNHALLLRLGGQYSDDLLVSLEQFPIGGPANVRAYPVAQALVDTGGAATLEWIIDAPGFADRPIGSRTWGDIFQLSFFYDYGGGELNDTVTSQVSKYNLRGYGMALQFSVSDKFYLRIDGAKPDADTLAPNVKDPQYYMSFSYTF